MVPAMVVAAGCVDATGAPVDAVGTASARSRRSNDTGGIAAGILGTCGPPVDATASRPLLG